MKAQMQQLPAGKLLESPKSFWLGMQGGDIVGPILMDSLNFRRAISLALSGVS